MGRYILEPEIIEMIESTPPGAGGEIQLTDALQKLLNLREIYAYNIQTPIYDIGNKLGFLKAMLNIALKHDQLKGEFGMYLQQLVATFTSIPSGKD